MAQDRWDSAEEMRICGHQAGGYISELYNGPFGEFRSGTTRIVSAYEETQTA